VKCFQQHINDENWEDIQIQALQVYTQIALQDYTVEYDKKYPGEGWTIIMWIEK
jgi:hypothetical protein